MDKYVACIKKLLIQLIKLPFILFGMVIRDACANIWDGKTGVIGTASYLVMAAFAAGFFYLWAQLTIAPAILIYSMVIWLIWDYKGASTALA